MRTQCITTQHKHIYIYIERERERDTHTQSCVHVGLFVDKMDEAQCIKLESQY